MRAASWGVTSRRPGVGRRSGAGRLISSLPPTHLTGTQPRGADAHSESDASVWKSWRCCGVGLSRAWFPLRSEVSLSTSWGSTVSHTQAPRGEQAGSDHVGVLKPACAVERAVRTVGGVSLQTHGPPHRRHGRWTGARCWAGSISARGVGRGPGLVGRLAGAEQPLPPTLGACLRTRWRRLGQSDLWIAAGICLIRKFSARKNEKAEGRDERLAPHRGRQSRPRGPCVFLLSTAPGGLAPRLCVSCGHCGAFRLASVTNGNVS